MKAAGTASTRAPRSGEDRGRARGSAGRSRWSCPARRRRASAETTISSPGLLVLGLAVDGAGDLDVEQVQLAVDGAELAVGADVHAGVDVLAPSPATRSAIEPATRSMPSSRAGSRAHVSRRAVERLGAARAGRSGVPSTVHFSGSTTSSRRRARRPRGRADRRSRGCARDRPVELSWIGRGAHRGGLSPRQCRLTGQSTGQQAYRAAHAARPASNTAHAYRGTRRIRPAASTAAAAAGAHAARGAAGRPLKRWRYVGVYGPELMLCAGSARIGPASPGVLGGVGPRGAPPARAHAALGGGVRLGPTGPGACCVVDGGVEIDLDARARADGVETICPHGGGVRWTRKQGGVRARGTRARGRPSCARSTRSRSSTIGAGYHARHTAWRWSPGVGHARRRRARSRGTSSTGIHDPPRDSERTVWVDGEPREVGPRRASPTISRAVAPTDGVDLRFAAEAAASAATNLLLVRSRLRAAVRRRSSAPALPGGARARRGLRA